MIDETWLGSWKSRASSALGLSPGDNVFGDDVEVFLRDWFGGRDTKMAEFENFNFVAKPWKTSSKNTLKKCFWFISVIMEPPKKNVIAQVYPTELNDCRLGNIFAYFLGGVSMAGRIMWQGPNLQPPTTQNLARTTWRSPSTMMSLPKSLLATRPTFYQGKHFVLEKYVSRDGSSALGESSKNAEGTAEKVTGGVAVFTATALPLKIFIILQSSDFLL